MVKNAYIILQQIYSGNCTKFHQNRQRFVEDITKTFWSLFSGHTVLLFPIITCFIWDFWVQFYLPVQTSNLWLTYLRIRTSFY